MVYYDTDWGIIVILATRHKEMSKRHGSKATWPRFDAFWDTGGFWTAEKREESGMKTVDYDAACLVGTLTL